jgi:hypothetical protein
VQRDLRLRAVDLLLLLLLLLLRLAAVRVEGAVVEEVVGVVVVEVVLEEDDVDREVGEDEPAVDDVDLAVLDVAPPAASFL